MLPARPIERVKEMPLCLARRIRAAAAQQEFALDAQQLGQIPELVVAFRSRQRLIDRREPFFEPADTAEGVGELAEKDGVIDAELNPAEPFERGAEHGRSVDQIAALDRQHALEAAPVSLPEDELLALRMLEQQAHGALGRRQ